MQRLSKRNNLYPKYFALEGVTVIGNDPVAGGSFADIYKGSFKNQLVCLKMVKVFESSQVDYIVKQFSHEAILWRQLSHPNLLPFFGLYYFHSRACLVSPWAENGHINTFLQNNTHADRALLVR